tara:strand:+ start:2530 stop:4011 length:1482 start_codon:yes stop_codon:yes gene_type:complete
MAVTTDPFSYNLEILTLVNNEGVAFDVRKAFAGLKLNESITQNFLSGELSIIDGVGLLENARLFGQETLHLKISMPGDDVKASEKIDKLFRIYHVGEVKRLAQDSLIYNLRFCSPELIQSKRLRISQAYKGGLINIAAQIARDYLDIDPDDLDNISKDEFEGAEVIIPNWTVNYAINWLCKEARGANYESPIHDSFYFYETANAGFRFDNLARMLDTQFRSGDSGGFKFIYVPPGISPETEGNVDMPWDYSSEQSKKNKAGPLVGVGRRILAYEIPSVANVLEGTVGGFYGSRQITLDQTLQQYSELSYNYHEKFNGAADNNTHPNPLVRQQPEVLYTANAADGEDEIPTAAVITNDPISNYKDASVTLVSSNQEKQTIAYNQQHGKPMFQQATEQLFNYNSLNLVLPSRTDLSVGIVIDVDISPSLAMVKDMEELQFHTGKYLITDIQWELSLSECKVNVRCIKDSLKNRIETTKLKLPDVIYEPEEEKENV